MSIAGIIDQAFASTSQKNIVIVEIPPGIGKTLYAVRKAYRRAKKGLVIYTANTHAAIMKALEYVLEEALRDISRGRRPPRIIYYMGTSRYCPFYTSPDAFRSSLQNAIAKGNIDLPLVKAGITSREFNEIRSILGMGYICRNICPVNDSYKPNKNAILVIPSSAMNIGGNLGNLISSLAGMGLVETYEPKIDAQGNPSGVCVRSRILRPSILFRTFLLAPSSSYAFLRSVAEMFHTILKNRSSKPIPTPMIILDEYDYILYKHQRIRVFLKSDIENEIRRAEEVISYMTSCASSQSPCYDPYIFIAAASAKTLGETILSGSSSYSSLVVENAAKTLFAPRAVEPEDYASIAIDAIRDINDDFKNKYGSQLVDADNLRSRDIALGLKVWGIGFGSISRKPGINMAGENIYLSPRQSNEYLSPIVSIIKSIRDPTTLFYSVEDGVIHASTTSLDTILRSDNTIMLSATGFPWTSDVYSTFSGIDIIDVSIGVPKETRERGFTKVEITASIGGKTRNIDILSLSTSILKQYLSDIELISVDLPQAYPENEDIIRDSMIMIAMISNELRDAWNWNLYTPGILVITQRKKLSEAIAGRFGKRYRVMALTPGSPDPKPLDEARDIMCYIADLKGVHVFITWYRSRFSRGVDLPSGYAVPEIISIGSPYTPPNKFDAYTQQVETGLYIPIRINGKAAALSAYRIDIAASYSEFFQAIGRAIRRRWQIMNQHRKTYKIRIHAPQNVLNKIPHYAPLWFQTPFIL